MCVLGSALPSSDSLRSTFPENTCLLKTELGRGWVAEISLFILPGNLSALLFDFLAKFPHMHADMAFTFFHGGIILDMPCLIPIATL